METKNGSVSINAENIFPIIKKWLYSEKDIFIREIVSNASDAINKLKKLSAVGEADLPEENQWRIDVILDKEAGTITVADNGIGMTEEEVIKYINQIAFSGAKDFIEKYEGKTDDAQIIGHFGLGFYSAFMVSDKVEIDTCSYLPGAESVHWESNTGMDYEITPSERSSRGTYITMHIAEDSKEYLEEFKLRDTLSKYFSFLPIALYFTNAQNTEDEAEDAKCTDPECKCEHHGEEDHVCTCEQKEKPAELPINDTAPLWQKAPKDCTDEEYKEFYHKVFHDFHDPLFWIHLNIDYPFNLKGILYFPKLKNEYEPIEGTIKVYYNQVFVADNVKEILPEFLMLLKGTIDCPDLPLNVSRSFLQNDGYVSKISSHITKKVADKLNGLFRTEREHYCNYWDDINPFVKFGCLKDEKFYDKVKDAILFKTTEDSYLTLNEYTDGNKKQDEAAADSAEEKEQPVQAAEKTETPDGPVSVYYIDNRVQQAQYVRMFQDSDIKVVVMDGPVDSHFINFVEYKNPGKIKFVRVDSDVSDTMRDTESAATREEMDQLAASLEGDFRKAAGNDKLKVKVEAIKSEMPAIILLSEHGRRMQEMAKMYGSMGFPAGDDEMTLVLNQSNATVKKLSELKADGSREKDYDLICQQVYDLAMLAHKPLDTDGMTRFIQRSAELLNIIAQA